jgi:hypothetical protein
MILLSVFARFFEWFVALPVQKTFSANGRKIFSFTGKNFIFSHFAFQLAIEQWKPFAGF